MKKLFSIFALLLLTAGLWAGDLYDVGYIDANGKGQTADDVYLIQDERDNVVWGEEGHTTWYYLEDYDIVLLSGGAVCRGDVRLILGNEGKLTVTGWSEKAGIEVSGTGNSLTIYGQSAQTGQLIVSGGESGAGIGGNDRNPGSNITINGGVVTANGGAHAAGIGGGYASNGSNITINGGTVTATGGSSAAGIGGGYAGNGSNITINGGTVTAIGGYSASGIGCMYGHAGSNIFVSHKLKVRADQNENPPKAIIPNDGSDLGALLYNKRYVTFALDPLADYKTAAIAEINDSINGITLLPGEMEYINTHISLIRIAEHDIKIDSEKSTIFKFLKLHDTKVAATQEIEEELGYMAEFELVRNLINLSAIGAADNAQSINEMKNNALSKMKEVVPVFDDIYAKGDSIGYARGKEEGLTEGLAQGKAEGKAEATKELLGEMAEPCTDCMAVEVTDGTTTVTLYAPTGVDYIKK